jgi:predicted amidophosphoribosyltransferase
MGGRSKVLPQAVRSKSTAGQARVVGIFYNSPKLAATLKCPNCGAVNSFDAKFCANCGKPLHQPEVRDSK